MIICISATENYSWTYFKYESGSGDNMIEWERIATGKMQKVLQCEKKAPLSWILFSRRGLKKADKFIRGLKVTT